MRSTDSFASPSIPLPTFSTSHCQTVHPFPVLGHLEYYLSLSFYFSQFDSGLVKVPPSNILQNLKGRIWVGRNPGKVMEIQRWETEI